MTKTFTRIAVAASLAGAIILPATAAQAGEGTERALLGAMLGGVAGAALSHGDGGATALGAVAGAAIGATTAPSHHRYATRYRYPARSYGGYGYRAAPYRTSYDRGYGYDGGYGYSRGYYDQYGDYRR